MIIELDILDHTILFEEQKNILMLIVDMESGGKERFKRII